MSEKGQKKPKKVKMAYTVHNIVKQEYTDVILDKIPIPNSDKSFISHYQQAVTDVIKEMDDETLEKVEGQMEEWNKNGGPSDVQLK